MDRPQKKETKRVRWTVGGNRIIYNRALTTPTADLTTVKLHINEVISMRGVKYTTMDIKDFYLDTPLEEYKYAKNLIKNIPNEIIDQYNLLPITRDIHAMI